MLIPRKLPAIRAFILAIAVVCSAAHADEQTQSPKPYRVIFHCDGHAVRKDAGGDLNQWIENLFAPLEKSHVDANNAHDKHNKIPPKGVAIVVVGPRANKLERFAADELCGYLDKLFGIKTGPTTELPDGAEAVLLVGRPKTNPNVTKALGDTSQPDRATGLPLKTARICVTGFDHNRPDDFPGLGDFIGWTSGAVRLANGELLFVHSAGYWHVSFATPVLLTDNLIEPYKKAGLDLNFKAPTGGRVMACRSTDNGKTWTKPITLFDGPLDDRPSAAFVTNKGTVIVIVNVQASWYGFPEAPEGRQTLNTRQLVLRSTDHGHTWSDPVPLRSSGTYYTRGLSHGVQLPDGGLLWMSYDMNKGSSVLHGTIHRSDDDGKTWRVISVIRRRKPDGDRVAAADRVVSGDADAVLKLGKADDGQWLDTDEGDLGRLSNGRLVLVVRPDGGTLVSDNNGVKWRQIGRVGPKYVYAPHLVVLADDTLVLTAGGSGGQCIFLSTDGGKTWSSPIKVDPGVYGYGKLTLLEDESLLLSYVWQHHAPQRCYMVRLKVNASRDGVELLPIAARHAHIVGRH